MYQHCVLRILSITGNYISLPTSGYMYVALLLREVLVQGNEQNAGLVEGNKFLRLWARCSGGKYTAVVTPAPGVAVTDFRITPKVKHSALPSHRYDHASGELNLLKLTSVAPNIPPMHNNPSLRDQIVT